MIDHKEWCLYSCFNQLSGYPAPQLQDILLLQRCLRRNWQLVTTRVELSLQFSGHVTNLHLHLLSRLTYTTLTIYIFTTNILTDLWNNRSIHIKVCRSKFCPHFGFDAIVNVVHLGWPWRVTHVMTCMQIRKSIENNTGGWNGNWVSYISKEWACNSEQFVNDLVKIW